MNLEDIILLIEDDEIDQESIRRSFKSLKIHNAIIIKESGSEALDYLKLAESSKVGLILLDLNLPQMSGQDILKIIKGQESTRKIPVVILTTSKAEQDRHDAFSFGAAGYFLKSFDFNEVKVLMRKIHDYWVGSERPF
ncbi:MAG: two-component system response regulator [Bacteriovoracaceae bacterium]|jgi:two-component system response regulator